MTWAHGTLKGLLWRAVWFLPRVIGGMGKELLALGSEQLRKWAALGVWAMLIYALFAVAWRWRPFGWLSLVAVFLLVLLWLFVATQTMRAGVRSRLMYRRIDQMAGQLSGRLGEGRVIIVNGGADMLRQLLTDPETEFQRDLGQVAAVANKAVREHLDVRPFAQQYAGPPNPFRRLKRARRTTKGDEKGRRDG